MTASFYNPSSGTSNESTGLHTLVEGLTSSSPVLPESGASGQSIFNTSAASNSEGTASATGLGITTATTTTAATTTATTAATQKQTEASTSTSTSTSTSAPPVKEVDDPTQQMGKQKSALGTKMQNEGQTQGAQKCSSYRGSDTVKLEEFLYTRGFREGACSDITIKAFGRRYPLHRLILDRSPFFSSCFNGGPWTESESSEITLSPETADRNITQHAFEIALARLYGHVDEAEEDAHALPLLAAASYLELQDLAESCVNSLLRNLTTTGIRDIVTFVTSSYYGPLTDRLLESAKALLYRDGWEMDFANGWDGISGEFAAEIIGYDGFYCPNEYARYCFVRDLINFRLKQSYSEPTSPVGGEFMKIPTTSAASIVDSDTVTVYADSTDDAAAGDEDPDIKPLRLLLENGIYFCHIDFAELQSIAEDVDFFGRPMVKESTIRNALWQQMQLRQKVLSCPNDSPELGISKTEFIPSTAAKKALTQNEASPANANDRQAASTNSPKKAISLNTSVATLRPKPSLSRLDQIFGCGRPARRYIIPSEDSSTTVIGDCPEPPTRRSASPSEGTKTTLDSLASETGEEIRYSEFPPFRFSVEFKSTASLKERKRVYSKTVFYAGSFWNIYIQKVVKGTKSVQLGVYLHRAKDRDGTGSQASSGIAQVSRDTELLLQPGSGAKGDNSSNTNSATGEIDPLDPTTTTTGDISLSRAATPRGGPSTSSTIDPALGFYEDTRPMIQTYFKIFSPSRKGKMLSMFSSRPDGFNFSQSWGWKSSSLILDEQERGDAGDRGTLRFMVVLGNV
ncbi:hypothetical protein BZA77DRAFT_352388 [Pyronema omphalodes]|nr:hypothetical protein BZA77DRAFT_352388 [Pyronema omphalodes]